jgi:allantoicase
MTSGPGMTFDVLPDLASRLVGGGVVHANDEFFAAADNLVAAHPPTFTPATFGAKGQVYDGWETRRRREPGHDHAIVRLGVPGIVRGVVIDTAFFTGNYPPEASIEACGLEGYPSPDELAAVAWTTLVPRSRLRGDSPNPFPVDVPHRFTHVRLSIYPDGGVARLRVHGTPVPDPRLLPDGLIDLAAMEHGGHVTACSNMFYGAPANLLMPGHARVMGEGWETARRREGASDWVEVRLAARGRVRLVELDASHFKGNAPASARVRGGTGEEGWFDILPETRLQPDTRHRFPVSRQAPAADRVRLDVYPDGGLARLRLWGRLDGTELAALAATWYRSLPPNQARQILDAAGVPVASDELDEVLRRLAEG